MNSADEIRLWHLRFDNGPNSLAGAYRILSPEEKERADAFRTPELRRNFILAHAATRGVLASQLGCKAEALDIRAGRFGKPFLVSGDIHFSLSHTRLAAAVAVSSAPVGFDIECPQGRTEDIEALAQSCLDQGERWTFSGLAPDARTAFFYRKWTEKEAFIKATGFGMQIDFRQMTLEPVTPDISIARSLSPTTVVQGEWWVHYLGEHFGHFTSVCSPLPTPRFTYRNYPFPAD